MANPNPYRARLLRRRIRRPLEMVDVLRILSRGILEADELLKNSVDPEFTLRCIHALSQACGQYSRLIQEGALEARLTALECELHGAAA
jgi:hypothetical protein